jgi:hypothetical protein
MRTSARLNLALAFVLFMGGGVYIAGWAVLWLTRGSYLTAVIALGAAVLSLNFAFHMAYVMSSAPRPRSESGAEGTVIRPQKIVDLVFGVGFIAGVSAAALYLIFAPFGMVVYVPSGVLRVGVPAFCGFLLVFGLPTVYRMFKHGGESHLRLQPSGFEVWNGYWGSFVRGKWEDVEQILDNPPRGRKPRREVIVFVLPKGPSAMLVADAITGNSRALREWVRFYWRHPEYRVELTDGRALRRLDEEKFAIE